MKLKAYAGIDPSINNTGVVVIDELGRYLGSMNGLSVMGRRGDYPSDVLRYDAQASGVAKFLGRWDIAAIGYEDYSFGSVHRAYSIAEFNGILKLALLRLEGSPNVRMYMVPPATNKKFGTGRGDSDKIAVSEHAVAECPALKDVPRFSDDICDAWFLARLAWMACDVERAAGLLKGSPHLRTQVSIALGFASSKERT